MAYVDVKVTVWERLDGIDEKLVPELTQKISTGELSDINQIYDFVEKKQCMSHSTEFLYDTQDSMTVEQNGGASTIELYDDNDDMIADNTFKFKLKEYVNKL